ncbi:hypothetical protein AOL_s00110g246 [Orbilia oligospora ATCC 24927]|uniref:Uncharacterized protein n=1 Tax=Arthrobotrys oligospora (strain ATCC 24927 / CBS 115.81 / DSM 1491) TaxID=756982 RepID=G1XL76_ARTOA|nr:hypothetical protein AOL_s00110g246 [Orbilia oligospora ATCC 24927]EGX46082.1 hypothetical protein AOL_s00110g246 [Orbilia oligospora ATCC 24927]
MIDQSEPQISAAEPSESVGDTTLIPFPGIRDGVQVFLGGSNGVEAYRIFGDYNLRTYSNATNKRHFLNLGAFRRNINRLGLWFERVLRQPISFWPLSQPRDLENVLGDGYSRFFWDCVLQDCGMQMSFQIDDRHFESNNKSTKADVASLQATKGGIADTAKARPIRRLPRVVLSVGLYWLLILTCLIPVIAFISLWYSSRFVTRRESTSASLKLSDEAINSKPFSFSLYVYVNVIERLYNRVSMGILCLFDPSDRYSCLRFRYPVDPKSLKKSVLPFTLELCSLVVDVFLICITIPLLLISFYGVFRENWNLLTGRADAIPDVAGAGGFDDDVDCDSPNIDMAVECSKRTAAPAGHQTTKTESRGQEPRKFRHARLRKKSRAAKEGNNSLPGSRAPSTNTAAADPVPKPPTISDNFQIFFCARGSVGDRDVVKVLKFSKSQNDRDLFSAFRKSYSAIRGWKLWFSFTHIHDIQYIKFNRYSSKQISRGDGLCYVDTTRQSLPDRQDKNYAIPHREPPVPIIRPMCRPEIMDHYDHPDDSINASNCIKFAMPKRVNDLPAGRCDAWGLYAAEAICPTKILIWALIVNIVPIFAFAPWWLVNHPGDLQNAFVPSTVISVAYFGTVSVDVAARMGKRYNYE